MDGDDSGRGSPIIFGPALQKNIERSRSRKRKQSDVSRREFAEIYRKDSSSELKAAASKMNGNCPSDADDDENIPQWFYALSTIEELHKCKRQYRKIDGKIKKQLDELLDEYKNEKNETIADLFQAFKYIGARGSANFP